MNGFFMATTRLLFSMGRGKFLHPWFLKVHPKYGTPTNAVLFTLVLTLSRLSSAVPPSTGSSICPLWHRARLLLHVLVAYKYAARFAEKAPWWSKSVAVVGALTSIACFLMLAVPGSPAAIGVRIVDYAARMGSHRCLLLLSRASILRSIPDEYA